jgi:alkylation response protein AidB-like acyl-CoA dehydrogenase
MRLIRAARDLAPAINAVRDTVERQRELPPALVDALGGAGMFSLLLPMSLGGAELTVIDYVRVIEALSQTDGSVGWCASVASAYSFFAGYLRPDVARLIYDGGRTVVAGALNPSGKAFVADGGYRVTGRWSYGSGIRHSTWVVGNCVVHDRDGPRRGSDGRPEIRVMIFPTSAVEVIDTWSVSGLRGTGSHDYRVADLFVPEDHTIDYFAPQAVQTGTLYAVPAISVLAVAIAAVPLGIARSAIDEVVALAAAKTPYGSSTPLRDKPTVQADVARAEVLLGSARSYLLAMIGELWGEVAGGGAASMQRRGMLRLACAHAAQASAQAVDLVYNAAGGTAIFETGRLERCFRDVHAVTQHIATSTSNNEAGGRMLLGLDPGAPRF